MKYKYLCVPRIAVANSSYQYQTSTSLRSVEVNRKLNARGNW
jgi:hypothetical protein